MRSRLSAIPDEIHPPKYTRTSQPLHYPYPPFLQSSIEIRHPFENSPLSRAPAIPRPEDGSLLFSFPSAAATPPQNPPAPLPPRSSFPRVCRARSPHCLSHVLPHMAALGWLRKKRKEKKKGKKSSQAGSSSIGVYSIDRALIWFARTLVGFHARARGH